MLLNEANGALLGHTTLYRDIITRAGLRIPDTVSHYPLLVFWKARSFCLYFGLFLFYLYTGAGVINHDEA